MHSSHYLVVAALALRAAAEDRFAAWAFGNMFSVGPANNAYITKATYSLLPPAVPCGSTMENSSDAPFMSIRVGISDSLSGDDTSLFQPLLNWSPSKQSQYCPGAETEWCVAASTYTSAGQIQQEYQVVPSNVQIDFEIDVDASYTISQKAVINGNVVSEQTDKNTNKPTWLYSSNEYYQNTCGTLKSYSWSNLTIVLSAADNNFANTLTLTNATSSGLTSTDKGKTWHADTIDISKDYFYKDGSEQDCSA